MTAVLNVRSTPAAIGMLLAGIGRRSETSIAPVRNLYGPSWSAGTGLPSLSVMFAFSVIWHSLCVATSVGSVGMITSDGPSGHVIVLPAGE